MLSQVVVGDSPLEALSWQKRENTMVFSTKSRIFDERVWTFHDLQDSGLKGRQTQSGINQRSVKSYHLHGSKIYPDVRTCSQIDCLRRTRTKQGSRKAKKKWICRLLQREASKILPRIGLEQLKCRGEQAAHIRMEKDSKVQPIDEKIADKCVPILIRKKG